MWFFSRLRVMGFFLSPSIYFSIASFIFSPDSHDSVYLVLRFFCAVSSSTSLPVSSSSTSFDEHLHNLLCIGFESTWQLDFRCNSFDRPHCSKTRKHDIVCSYKEIFNFCLESSMVFIIMKFPLQIYITSSICFSLCKWRVRINQTWMFVFIVISEIFTTLIIWK